MKEILTEFIGQGIRLTEEDYVWAASTINCDLPTIKAVVRVESANNGFLYDKRPKILFESHWFHKLTRGKYDRSNPSISTSKWVYNYKGGTKEYDRLAEALELNRDAALKSASWGLFQILGVNHFLVGYPNINDFIEAMKESERKHLEAFLLFLQRRKIDEALRTHDWERFAKTYNGPSYQKHGYDTRLRRAYDDIATV